MELRTPYICFYILMYCTILNIQYLAQSADRVAFASVGQAYLYARFIVICTNRTEFGTP